MQKKNLIPFSNKRLNQAIGLNAKGVSLQSLADFFGFKEDRLPELQAEISSLIDDGKVALVRANFFVSTRPLSDLVIARVCKSLVDKNTKVELEIRGIDDDFPFSVTLSKKLIRKKFGNASLTTRDSLAVVLERKNGTELVATHIIDKVRCNKPPTVVGYFNRKSDRKFTTYLPSITTLFDTFGQVPVNPNNKTSFIAKIPPDLDPYDPALEIAEQKWDPETGVPIASIIAKKHNISPRHEHRATVEARLACRWKPDVKTRRDLTQEPILVIDPPNARDHDDGILIQRMRDGGYRTLVVVSDVPVFVRSGTSLDTDARNRAFSHYLPDDTFHMLPSSLVRHASLMEGRSKPVVYVEQFWDEDGNQTEKPNIGLGIIASQKQMTYGQFEDMVLERPRNIASYIELGDIFIEKMRHEKIIFDTDDRSYRHSYSQMLVASLMIEANTAMAEFLLYYNVPFLSRSHTGSDNIVSFHQLKEKLEDWGYEVPENIGDMHDETLRRILAEAEARNDKRRVEFEIRNTFLNQAVYTTRPFSHFGLNRENYTHGTSPIRRYADLITLRGVHTALWDTEYGLTEDDIDQLQDTATKLNFLQDSARRISNDVDRYYAVRDLQRLEGHNLRATLGKIDPYRVEIILNQQYALRKQIPIANLPEGWRLGNDLKSLTYNGIYAGSQNSPIRVRVCNVRPHMGDWDFDNMTPALKKTPTTQPRPTVTVF